MDELRAFALSLKYKTSEASDYHEVVEYKGLDLADTFGRLKKAEPDAEALQKDIVKMSILFVTRGNNLRNIMAKTGNDQAKASIAELESKYSILSSLAAGKPGVTLARVAACFPNICGHLMLQGFGRKIIEGYDDLPLYLQFTQAPSIIPKSDTGTFKSFVRYSIEVDKVINSGKKGMVFDSDREAIVERYAKASWNSPLFSEEERKAVIDDLKDGNTTNVLLPSSGKGSN